MNYLVIFIFGYIAAFIGTVIPGLLNMTAGKITYEYNAAKGLKFILGACTMTAIYSFTATQFSFYIDAHPDIVTALYKLGAIIFGILTVYFFWKGYLVQQNKLQHNIDRNNFFLTGVLLAFLNVLPIPFYTGVTLLLAKNEWLHFHKSEIAILIFSIVFGTFSVLKLYSIYYPKMNQKRKKDKKSSSFNANYLVGSITLTLTGFALYKLL